ncbi:MAG TPA: F0F1 ATP synthase subunit delta [Gammaproteobacteria bacterium]|nr:F0F1 ATP synthase subunit delta [Gammaproteobacteria bacterium]MCH78790.1 F0F1 ATP synthase subunit delta [Gammaproteobacteria bacterium]
MAELATVARPYAEALFRAVDPAQAAELVVSLQQLAQVTADTQLRAFADNPKVSVEQVTQVVLAALPGDVSPVLQGLLQTVVENDRLAAMGEIARQFQALVDERAGVARATVYSAFELSSEQLQQIEQTLSARFGRTLEARPVVDRDLIGGVRVVVGDQVLDASVRSRLEQMRTALTA